MSIVMIGAVRVISIGRTRSTTVGKSHEFDTLDFLMM